MSNVKCDEYILWTGVNISRIARFVLICTLMLMSPSFEWPHDTHIAVVWIYPDLGHQTVPIIIVYDKYFDVINHYLFIRAIAR